MWIGVGFATCVVIFLLIQWHQLIFSNLSEKTEIIKHWVDNLGIWAPLAYLLGYVLRPLLLFPAVPFAILGGVLFGSFWGAIYVLIGRTPTMLILKNVSFVAKIYHTKKE